MLKCLLIFLGVMLKANTVDVKNVGKTYILKWSTDVCRTETMLSALNVFVNACPF